MSPKLDDTHWILTVSGHEPLLPVRGPVITAPGPTALTKAQYILWDTDAFNI